ncbi:MAG: hypothetical protein GC189_12245 [Alphaproteobacteria bacterium]|nr:hypothetical protein [Alphaproteobacteria bacterium]
MADARQSDLKIRLLGPLQIERGGSLLQVPSSRKARAILGYLVMSPRPVTRQRLCDLFFDAPDDPRASLRWTLSKLRALVDEPDVARLVGGRDVISFSAEGASVDVIEVLRPSPGADAPNMTGAFLEDAELPERQDFMIWLQAARDELRVAGASRLRDALTAADLNPERRLTIARQLQALEPLDEVGLTALVQALTHLGRLDAAREAVADAERAFRRAGMRAPSSLRAISSARAPDPPQPPPAPAAPAAARTVLDMLPRVAIAPFQNYSGDAISEDVMQGFLESVIHMVSRFRFMRVLSAEAGTALQSGMRDPSASHLGAEYLVGGSIMARGQVLRLRYRVVDARSGALLTSGDIDAPALSPAALLTDLPEQLAPHIAQHCMELERTRASALDESARTAADHYFRGLRCAYFTIEPDFDAASRAFQSALAAAPNFAAAMAASAHCNALLLKTRDPEVRKATVAQAHAAIALAPDDAFALSLAAWSLVQAAQDVEPALRASELAIRLNPLALIVWNVNAWIRAMAGEVETPLERWDEAERCSPMGGSLDLVYSGRALCLWMAGRYDESLSWAKRSLERTPNNPGGLTAGLAAAAVLNDKDALQDFTARLMHHYPQGADSPVIQSVPIVAPGKREAILRAVREGVAAAQSG